MQPQGEGSAGMDRIDLGTIELLKKDARTAFSEIAKRLGVVEGTIRKRVAKLLKAGAIRKFTVQMGGEFEQQAIICIKTNPQTPTETVIRKLKKLSVEDVYEVTGKYDVICIARVHSLYDLNELLEQIRATKAVVETECFTVLKKD